MRVVVAAERAPQPWANGGGTTRDLALGPAPAGSPPPAFDWRLSLADIDRDGPFSVLAGVDRVFAVVEGALALTFAGDVPTVADAASAPLAFDGARAPRAALAGASRARALNLMCARGRRAGAMRRVSLADGERPDGEWARGALDGGARVHGWYVQAGRVRVGGVVHDAGTLLLVDPALGVERAGAAHADAGLEASGPSAIGPARLVEIAVRAPSDPPVTDPPADRPPAPRTSR